MPFLIFYKMQTFACNKKKQQKNKKKDEIKILQRSDRVSFLSNLNSFVFIFIIIISLFEFVSLNQC